MFVSLSHYCPTVARMAFAGECSRGIVPAPDALVAHLHLEGLDARDALPPLLQPGMLTDLEGYRAWEREAVGFLERGDAPETAIARIRMMTERLLGWSPGRTSLAAAVEAASAAARTTGAGPDGRRAEKPSALQDFETVRRAIPEVHRPTPAVPGAGARDARWVAPAWSAFAHPLGRFLAAHAFANWTAYLGTGLESVVRSLEVALVLVRVEAGRLCEERQQALDPETLLESFRAADLLLVHLSDPKALAAGIERS